MSEYYLIDNPPARSQFRKTRRAKPTGCIVLHTAESILDEIGPDSGAENVARFIQRRGTPGSYHRIGDRDSIVKLIPFSYEAWQDGTGSNAWAIGISLAMEAHTWPDLSMAHRTQLIETMAKMAREAANWLKAEHGITVPAVRLTKAESDAGKPGFIPHASRDPKRRSDPGKYFPWVQFFNRYNELNGETPVQDPNVRRVEAVAERLGYSNIVQDGKLTDVEAAAVENMEKGVNNLISHNDRLAAEVDELRSTIARLNDQLAGNHKAKFEALSAVVDAGISSLRTELAAIERNADEARA